jgi:hypothetical protein
MRWLTYGVLVLAMLAGGCPRTGGQEALPVERTASHPWELPGYALPESVQATVPPPEPVEGAVETPALRGPLLAEEDTLDPALVPGRWLQICQVRGERLTLMPTGEMDLLTLNPDGTGTWMLVREGEPEHLAGTWAKSGPGVLSMGFGGAEPQPMYCQLHAGDFLYIWSYDHGQGFWFARLPEEATETIAHNRFDTTRGRFLMSEVGEQAYRGTVTGESELTVAGYYQSGVLSMRWENEQHNQGGYAAFIVSPEWESLEGVWWIDDYEAVPFGGPWSGTAAAAAETPPEPEEPAAE